MREAIRVHAVTRAAAVRARTAAINELKAIIVTADDTVRCTLARAAHPHSRSPPARDSVTAPTCRSTSVAPGPALRAFARRIEHLDAEVDDHDRAPQGTARPGRTPLLAERGIGYVTAAAFYIAWSHPGRCRSEAAFARLGGTSPVAATSGLNQTQTPPQPRRRPATEPGALPRGHHQAALRPGHQDLHRPTDRRRQDRPRNHPLHQTVHRPPRLATPRAPTVHPLTDIEASGVSFAHGFADDEGHVAPGAAGRWRSLRSRSKRSDARGPPADGRGGEGL